MWSFKINITSDWYILPFSFGLSSFINSVFQDLLWMLFGSSNEYSRIVHWCFDQHWCSQIFDCISFCTNAVCLHKLSLHRAYDWIWIQVDYLAYSILDWFLFRLFWKQSFYDSLLKDHLVKEQMKYLRHLQESQSSLKVLLRI